MTNLYDSAIWYDFDCGHPGGLTATQSLLERSGLCKGAHVLDLACGVGDSVMAMLETGLNPTGLDRSVVLERAKQKYPDLPDKLWQVWQDNPWQPLPFADSSVDAVLCECSFSLFTQPTAVLNEVRRVLVSNGLFLISDVTTDKPFNLTGFKRLEWQDETDHLKAFVARWIWETGSAFPTTCQGTHYFSAVYQIDAE